MNIGLTRAAARIEPISEDPEKSVLRIGLIGCGGIAAWHIAAVEALPDLRLTAVCDATPAFAQKVGEKHRAEVYPDADALLGSGNVDAVAICTPSGTHAELGIKALSHHVYPIVEKPMAITPESLDALLEAEKKSRAFICPISQLRFLPDVQRVRDWMNDRALGKLTLADLSMKYWREDDYYTQKPWRGTWAFDGGGALMNQGIHGVDLLRYLCGTPVCISAAAATLCHPIETEDTLSACLQFSSGAICTLSASTASFPGFPRRLELCGEKGSLTLEEGDLVVCSLPGAAVTTHSGGGHGDPLAIDTLPHRLQYRNIADAIRHNTPPAVTSADVAETLRLIFDIYRAAGLRP